MLTIYYFTPHIVLQHTYTPLYFFNFLYLTGLTQRRYQDLRSHAIYSVLVNCVYFNPQNDYRIYDPDLDKKTKIDHFEEMILNAINNKKIPLEKEKE